MHGIPAVNPKHHTLIQGRKKDGGAMSAIEELCQGNKSILRNSADCCSRHWPKWSCATPEASGKASISLDAFIHEFNAYYQQILSLP